MIAFLLLLALAAWFLSGWGGWAAALLLAVLVYLYLRESP